MIGQRNKSSDLSVTRATNDVPREPAAGKGDSVRKAMRASLTNLRTTIPVLALGVALALAGVAPAGAQTDEKRKLTPCKPVACTQQRSTSAAARCARAESCPKCPDCDRQACARQAGTSAAAASCAKCADCQGCADCADCQSCPDCPDCQACPECEDRQQQNRSTEGGQEDGDASAGSAT